MLAATSDGVNLPFELGGRLIGRMAMRGRRAPVAKPPSRVGQAGGGARSRTRRVLGADCAVGSGEWAEPPQYLPAMAGWD